MNHMATIYEEIGGKASVTAAVDLFYERVLTDPLLSPYFANTDMKRQKRHMRAVIAGALGGPDLYAGRDMGAAHAHLSVTGQAFDAVVRHLVATLETLGVTATTIGAIGARIAPLREVIVREPLAEAA